MVLSNKPLSSANAARDYYSHGDYYGSEGKGLWLGDGANELGLNGEFSAKSDQAFSNILKGILPNGQILGRRTKDGIKHRPGLDLTFSCPKSFSIQTLLYADKEEKAALELSMMNAVTKTLNYIEKQGYVVVRKGQGGYEIEKLNKLAFATFKHTTNRNLEPQAHVHCFLANVAKCKDGKFRSIAYDKVFENTKFLGQVFRNELAFEVKKLGYEISTKTLSDGSSSFELANIHPKLIKAFSTRRQEIIELCKLYGITTKEGRDKIVINSRKAKKSVRLEDLLNTWRTIESNVMKEVAKKEKENLSTQVNPDTSRAGDLRIKGNQLDNTSIKTNPHNNEFIKSISSNEKIETVYKALYSRLPDILPEFGFMRKGTYYISTTGQKVDGSVGKKSKIYVYANNPGMLVDYTRGSKSVWDYIQERHMPGSSNSEVFQYLASMSGLRSDGKLELPNRINAPNIQETKEIEPATKQAVEKKSWELVYKFSLEKIRIENNQVSKYLQARGYNKETIGKMGIGYIASKKELSNYLISSKISAEQVTEVRKALGYIGGTHKMVIPYCDKAGQIMGLAARNIKYTQDSELGKYMYTKGLQRNSTLLNIHEAKPEKELIIVEGMLDCLHAKAEGIDNVVALGGTGLSQSQAGLIKELGINKVTVCLDSDKAGQEASERVANLISANNPEVQIKIANLPKGIKDFDELLMVKGTEVANEVIAKAALKERVMPEGIQETEKILTPKQLVFSGSQSNSNDIDGNSAASPELHAKDLAKLCIDDVTHHKVVFVQEELLNKMMKYSIGSFSVIEIQKEVNKLEQSGSLIRVEDNITTKELLDKEKQILKYAKNGLDQTTQILKNKHFENRCANFERREQAKYSRFKINDQQKRALKHILTSKDNIVAIEGLPGVGKSTVLNAVRDISNRKVVSLIGFGEKFHGIAPTASAAKTLNESANVESRTLHSLLGKYQGYIEDRGTHESLQALRREFKKVIMFLDESSLVSTRIMWKLLKLQDKLGFRIILIGDTKQLGAVEAGNPFEQMLKVIPSVKLDKIIRQEDDLSKEAVIASSKGDIAKTFAIHNSNIKEEQDINDLAKEAVSLYLQKDLKQRDNTLLISPTRNLRDKINNKIRIELKKEGVLQGEPEKFVALRQKDMTIADYKFAASLQGGDVIKFNTSYKNGINKGDYFTVTKANQINNSLTLDKEGKHVIYRLKRDVSYENKFEVFEKIDLKLQEGLKIRFTKNNKELGLINSEIAIIQKIGKDYIALRLEDDSVKNIPKTQLKHVDYGYCITIHSAQGKTFDSTIAVISSNKWLNNQKSWLVTLSRHRNEFTALVQNKNKLESYLMKNKGNEVSAMELVSQTGKNQESLLKVGINSGTINTKKEIQIQV